MSPDNCSLVTMWVIHVLNTWCHPGFDKYIDSKEEHEEDNTNINWESKHWQVDSEEEDEEDNTNINLESTHWQKQLSLKLLQVLEKCSILPHLLHFAFSEWHTYLCLVIGQVELFNWLMIYGFCNCSLPYIFFFMTKIFLHCCRVPTFSGIQPFSSFQSFDVKIWQNIWLVKGVASSFASPWEKTAYKNAMPKLQEIVFL